MSTITNKMRHNVHNSEHQEELLLNKTICSKKKSLSSSERLFFLFKYQTNFLISWITAEHAPPAASMVR